MRDQHGSAGYPSIAPLSYVAEPGENKPPASPREAVLADLGISPADFAEFEALATRNGSDPASEMLVAGRSTEEGLAQAIATALGLRRKAPAESSRPLDVNESHRILLAYGQGPESELFIAPTLADLDGTARFLARQPGEAQRCRIATVREIATCRADADLRKRSQAARLGFSADRPDLSARSPVTGAQGFAAGLLVCAIAALAAVDIDLFLIVLHLVFGPLFLGCIAMRAFAAHHAWRERGSRPAWPAPPQPAPLYSVLVALHDEVESVPRLVATLAELDWPRSRLEVFLVCEADDAPTIAAVRRAIAAEVGFQLVTVPPSTPRTKPKALNVALPLARGDYLVLYDAEDRPGAGQLAEAAAAFAAGGERLACLQAPLVVTNGARAWLAGQFAIEYAALFGGLLPWLASRGLPLPLGGTSNHFRREALVRLGGWDSHNVTEDADLGMRLVRSGYRVGTLGTPTLEAAPERFGIWLRQRTRWMKGWMQTYLVHMRAPLRLQREIGWRAFLAFQILFFGMIASAVAQILVPPLLASTGLALLNGTELDGVEQSLLAFDLALLVGAFAVFAALALATAGRGASRGLAWRLATLHLYWTLISLAAFRALGQLVHRPQLWEKTPHGRVAEAAAVSASRSRRTARRSRDRPAGSPTA